MIKRPFRKLNVFLGISIAAASLVACSSNSGSTGGTGSTGSSKSDTPAPAAAKSGSGGKVAVRAMNWASTPYVLEKFNEVAKEFNDKNPNIDAQMEYVNTGFPEKLLASFAAGNGPDIYYVNITDLADRVAKGMAEPIDEYAKKTNFDLNDIAKPALMQLNGKTYGWATQVQTQVLFYNKKMFTEAGVPFPTDTWTWDDLAQAAKKLTKKSGDNVTQYGFQADELNRIWYSYVLSNGGKIFDDIANPTKPLFNDAVGVAGAKYLVDLVSTLGAAPQPGVKGAIGSREAFQNNKVAMTLDGAWMTAQWATTPGLDLGVALVPQGSAGHKVWLSPTLWIMNPQGKHKDEAWKFMSEGIGSKKTHMLLSDMGGIKATGMPSYKSVLSDPNWKPLDSSKIMAKEIEYAEWEPIFPGAGKWYWDIINAGLQGIIVGKQDPQKAIEQMAAKTQTDILDPLKKK